MECHHIPLLLLIFCVKRISSTTCSCDLLANSCNINCCCDPDCTEEDKVMFNSCTELNSEHIEEVCVSDDLLFSVNGKYQIEGSGGGLLCLYKNNYNAKYFYSDVTAVTDQAAFAHLANKFHKSTYGAKEYSQPSYENSFKVGDPLFILFTATNHEGFLPQPLPFLTNECEDSNPARFLLPQESDCFRIVKVLADQCSTEHSWNARSYIDGYKIAPYPSLIFGEKRIVVGSNNSSDTIEITKLVDQSLLIEPRLVSFTCQDSSGKVEACSFPDVPQSPSYNETTQICKNVVKEIMFSVSYKNNVTVQITNVNVSLVLGDVSTSFMQRNLFVFTAEENITSNATNKTMPYKRSGNPGYIIGLPVIVAIVEGDGDTQVIYSSNMNDSVTFSTIKTTSKGVCNSVTNGDSISFGMDIRTGCFVYIDNVMTLTKCEKLQNDVLKILLGNLPTHVASFGNPDPKKISDWISIINKPLKNKPGLSNGQCYNIYTSVSLEILYASTGFLKNPQRRIVGVEVKYGRVQKLLSQCFGLFCQPSTKEKVEVVQAVTFIDVSLTPQAQIKSKPEFKSKAPNDFFYPFLT